MNLFAALKAKWKRKVAVLPPSPPLVPLSYVEEMDLYAVHAEEHARLARLRVTQSLPVSNTAVLHANGHFGSPLMANTCPDFGWSITEVVESTESEIVNMAKVKEPERKRFATSPSVAWNTRNALHPDGAVGVSTFGAGAIAIVLGIGECDTLEDARLMVKAKFGRLQKASLKKLPDRRVDIVNYGGGLEETYAS